MATEQIMATWERDANERAAVALATLTERFDLDIPTEQPERLDARMRQIRVLQRHTLILEALAAATGKKAAKSDLPADVKAEVMKDGTPVVVTEDDEPSNAEKLESIGFNAAGFPKKPKRVKIVDANTGEQLNKDEGK